MWRRKTASFIIFVLLVSFPATAAFAVQKGFGEVTALVGDKKITVFTFRPSGCERPDFLFVFHGADRNAADYRDYAAPIADRHNAGTYQVTLTATDDQGLSDPTPDTRTITVEDPNNQPPEGTITICSTVAFSDAAEVLRTRLGDGPDHVVPSGERYWLRSSTRLSALG